MVLAEAFMKRNDLKKQITLMNETARENLWQDKSIPISFKKGSKINPSDAYTKAVELMQELQALNTAITEANMVNNKLLRDLETTTARIALIDSILQDSKNYPGDRVKERNYATNEAIFVDFEWNIDTQKLQETQEALTAHKRELEKELAHNNYSIEVKGY